MKDNDKKVFHGWKIVADEHRYEPVEVSSETPLEDMYSKIDCKWVDALREPILAITGKFDDMWFDDEGLINSNPHEVFQIAGCPPIKGNALFFGHTDEGDIQDSELTEDDMELLMGYIDWDVPKPEPMLRVVSW